MSVPSVTLPSGESMPIVGIGTWDLDDDGARESVRAALEAGYSHIDTAEGYRNESAIGDVLADYDREDMFLTSKILPSNLDYESVLEACEDSLDRLGTNYLDLYLIHWPNPAISLRETLQAMERLHDRGLVRHIGVSNFSAYQLSAAQHISDVPIAVNQIEFHPWFQRPDLISYCQESDVIVEAAAPLARTAIFDDEVVQELATEYDRTPAQIVLRWAIEEDVVVIPKSTSEEHIRQNANLFEWELTAEDHQRLTDRDRRKPVYDAPARDWTDDVYGIAQ